MKTPKNPVSNENSSEKKKPRCVADDVLLVQADEDVTKSQENGRKQNKTYTATIEEAYGRCEYLVARSSVVLQHLVGVILVLMGLFKKKRLEVIRDGASWIATWIGAIMGRDVCHILCWYHLCKKVCYGLSGLGGAKERRELLQREILGYLWQGNVSQTIEKLKQILPECRVASRVEELIDYLTRKRHMIVNDENRHAAGIGLRAPGWSVGTASRFRIVASIKA